MPTLTTQPTEKAAKLDALIRRKEREQEVILVDSKTDREGNVHVLMRRYPRRQCHIVWTTFDTGEEETTYSDFYKGMYNLSHESGLAEIRRRWERTAGY